MRAPTCAIWLIAVLLAFGRLRGIGGGRRQRSVIAAGGGGGALRLLAFAHIDEAIGDGLHHGDIARDLLEHGARSGLPAVDLEDFARRLLELRLQGVGIFLGGGARQAGDELARLGRDLAASGEPAAREGHLVLAGEQALRLADAVRLIEAELGDRHDAGAEALIGLDREEN